LRFRRSQGETLERFCLFQVLHTTHAAETAERTDWRRWAPALRDPGSAEVQAFAAAHRDEIDFLAWAHWVADEQLAACARRAEAGGMAIGLYRDLAVGADAAGAESWANPTVVVAGAHAGAPPDIHNPAGQDWGLPPFDPRRLRAEAYASFIALLRANMRHAGALRIDHVVALQHLYWVPAGQPPASGAYVRYPMEELIGILALESHRHQCLIIGEDLGTVPEGFRERMTEAAILSYRVLPFEQDAESGALVLPAKYPLPGARHLRQSRSANPARLVARTRHRDSRATRSLSRAGRGRAAARASPA
jgi:4-alpha-glucanotransferase